MTRVVILGSTGLLGNAVAKEFLSDKNFETFTSYRKEKFKWNDNSFYFDANKTSFECLPQCDYVINCIGIIKPYMEKNLAKNIYVNSIFPHKLSEYCEKNGIKMVHITTDCVFSGKEGKYTENSHHDCLDNYGKSKSLGEAKSCMVIRTSIIGEEIHSNSSLVEWVKSMKGKEINGFTNHLWNGVTTKQYGKICKKIIEEGLYENNLFHVHSDDISKMELVSIINKVYNLNISISPIETDISCDRRLRTIKQLNKKLNIPNLEYQIKEMRG